MFNPAIASDNIRKNFIDYITTTFSFADEKMQELFKNELLNGLDGHNGVSKGPFVDVKDIFETDGETINTLIDKGLLSPLFRDLEKTKDVSSRLYKHKMPLNRQLYKHQIKAIEILSSNKRNTVVTTGTGSGKTECFLIPILNSLLKEKEAGTLGVGVRALLIYPMNALANDQMKRLRDILMKYEDITFGVYNGDTKKTYKKALTTYKELHCDEECKNLQEPLNNELISREQMQSTPPHILCTNYAMLEHMLLRPDNDMLFENADYKFIVLDEAHIYSGTTGMETALLLRRLSARIKAKGKTQYVLTSATLGKEGECENAIVQFAQNLTGESFSEEDIVFGRRVEENFSTIKSANVNISVFSDISAVDSNEDIESVFNKHHIAYDKNISTESNIYDLCRQSILYKQFRQAKLTDSPLSIKEYSEKLGLTENQVIKFIYTCTLAEKNDKSLIDARYHFFVRALEGAYGNLTGKRSIFLERKKYDNNKNKCFEFVLCRTCGDLGLVGKIIKEDKLKILEQSKQYEDIKNIRYFHILSETEIEETLEEFEDDELDETLDEEQEDNKIKKGSAYVDQYLCCKCGAISEREDGEPKCTCGRGHSILVREFKDKQIKCVKCQSGKYSRFYLGNEAATAVLATSLFEELPSKIVIERNNEIDHEREGGKQFLAFSDSRSEAAFFASYLGKSYKEFLRRRGMIQIINKNKNDIIDECWNLEDLAEELAKHFKKTQAFRETLSSIQDVRKNKKLAIKNAWIAVLSELVNARRRTSLVSLGYVKFEYAGNTEHVVSYFVNKYKVDKIMCKNLLDEVAMSFAYFGAIDVPENSELEEEEKKYIFYTSKQKAIVEIKNSETNRTYMGFLARNREGKNTFYRNSRQKLVMDSLGKDDVSANEFLSDYFNEVLINPKNKFKATRGAGEYYFMAPRNFIIRVNGDNVAKWFRCKKCNKITTTNIAGNCNTYGCHGLLTEINPTEYFYDNHYTSAYNKPYFTPLIIREHTAQLSRSEGQKYQDDFSKNLIHALSCSTTFEMGVDVGELETVFLRNVPPTSANYAQRAGRAGRSKNIAAYALTYAKLSSHDFNYFKNPVTMINGDIVPPNFKTNNKKIVLRHIYSVVLSCFFKEYKEYFNNNKASEFLENGGLEALRIFIERKSRFLTTILAKSFCENIDKEFGISTYKWIDRLIGESGIMTKLMLDYNETVDDFEQSIAEHYNKREGVKGERTEWQLKLYKNKQMIEFLTRGNILPRYGFPVDTAELSIANKEDKMEDLQLVRDLKLAISEYAPGESVVANNKMYTSRYLRKSFVNGGMEFHRSYVNQCSNCGAWNYRKAEVSEGDNKHKCVNCLTFLPAVNWMESIEPRDGFVSDGESPKEVPMRRPDKIYVNEDSYIGNQKEIIKHKYKSNENNLILCSTENDEILVTSKTLFYVCKCCGFTYGILDSIKDEKGRKDTAAIKGIHAKSKWINTKKNHKTPSGGRCPSTKLFREVLNHTFKTDVVTIEFENKNYSKDMVISAMFAILNAISTQLNVERTDINGCVKYSISSTGQSYSIVLYDAVAGGAGYVRALVSDYGNNLTKVFKEARRSMECTCDTSCYACLRSYQNQRHHDSLNRHLAKTVLNDYIDKIQFVEIIEPEKSENVNIYVNENTGLDVSSLQKRQIWKNLLDDIEDEKEKEKLNSIITLLEKLNYRKPDYSDIHLSVNEEDMIVDLIWIEKKIILCSSYNSETYDMIKNDSTYNIYDIMDLNLNNFARALED